MAMSTICKLYARPRRLSAASDPGFRQAVGNELRARRLERALSQAELAAPLTRAYVSAVETGRVVPSLAALQHLTARLGIPLSTFFDGVEQRWSSRT